MTDFQTEPVAWTLLDTHTPANPNTRYPTRERAIAAVKAWAWLHPDQADRYTVCALIPDGFDNRRGHGGRQGVPEPAARTAV